MNHSTDHKNILGYIDEKNINGESINVSGWCLTKKMEIKPLRIISKDCVLIPKTILRTDVCNVYKIQSSNCGWKFEAELPCTLQIELDGKWESVFSFLNPKQVPKFQINNSIPSYIVVDNFYENPDLVRKICSTM